MFLLTVTAALAVAAGILAWFLLRRWSGRDRRGELTSPRAQLDGPLGGGVAEADVGPTAIAGAALSFELAVLAAGVASFGIVLFMVRGNVGFARLDLWATDFGAHHATSLSTAVFRLFTQLGGAVVLVPMACGVAVFEGIRRRHVVPLVGFLTLAVGGQYLLVDTVKSVVDRVRPDVDRLTGFSGPSFPSGHAAAAATCFAAFAVLLGAGRSKLARAGLGAGAVAVAVAIAATRVFLGVHWLTDVIAGLAVGWAWFALCMLTFAWRGFRIDEPSGPFPDARHPSPSRTTQRPCQRGELTSPAGAAVDTLRLKSMRRSGHQAG